MLFLGILVSVEVTCFQEHHFTPNSFSGPPENIRNLWFSDIFRGYRKKIIAWNGLFGSISLKFQVKFRHGPLPFILFVINFHFISYFWCFTLFYFSGKYSNLLTNRHQTPRVTNVFQMLLGSPRLLSSIPYLNILAILCHWSLSMHPENIRKPLVFWYFQGGIKREQWHEMY